MFLNLQLNERKANNGLSFRPYKGYSIYNSGDIRKIYVNLTLTFFIIAAPADTLKLSDPHNKMKTHFLLDPSQKMRKKSGKKLLRVSRTSAKIFYYLFYVCGLVYTTFIVTSNLRFYFKYSSNMSQTEIDEDPQKVQNSLLIELWVFVVGTISKRHNLRRFNSLETKTFNVISNN